MEKTEWPRRADKSRMLKTLIRLVSSSSGSPLDWCYIKIFLMVILHWKQGELNDKTCKEFRSRRVHYIYRNPKRHHPLQVHRSNGDSLKILNESYRKLELTHLLKHGWRWRDRGSIFVLTVRGHARNLAYWKNTFGRTLVNGRILVVYVGFHSRRKVTCINTVNHELIC